MNGPIFEETSGKHVRRADAGATINHVTDQLAVCENCNVLLNLNFLSYLAHVKGKSIEGKQTWNPMKIILEIKLHRCQTVITTFLSPTCKDVQRQVVAYLVIWSHWIARRDLYVSKHSLSSFRVVVHTNNCIYLLDRVIYAIIFFAVILLFVGVIVNPMWKYKNIIQFCYKIYEDSSIK